MTAKLQKGVAQTNISTADAMAKAKLNFSADATIGEKDLESALQGIATRTGVRVADVAASASGAFSAGARTNAEALAAVEAGFQIAPFDAGQASELSQRAIDLSKKTGADPRAAIGFMMNVGKAARTTDLQKLGAQGLPAMLSVMAMGDSAEQAAELYATITQIKGDKEGSVSKTIATNLAEQLGSFADSKKLPRAMRAQFQGAKSTADRIAMMQADPKLRAAFLEEASFGSEGNAAVRDLLSGDPAAMALYRQSQGTIGALDHRQIAAFEAKRKSIEDGKFEGIAAAKRDADSALESFGLGNTTGARASMSRDMVEAAIDRSGLGKIERGILSTEFESRAMFSSPESAARSVLERLQAGANITDPVERAAAAGGGASLPTSSPEYRDLLQRQLNALERMEKRLADQKPQRVEVTNMPGRPQTPIKLPSSGLNVRR